MACIGEAIRHFPYSKHVLYRDEMNGLYYGISHTIYTLFKKRVFTKRFKKKDELQDYMKTKGYKVSV